MTHPGVPPPDARFGFAQVYLGGEVCKWLYVMKGRLQMEEGAICRLAIWLSLGEPYAPDLALIDQEGGKMFSVASLSGSPMISTLLFALPLASACSTTGSTRSIRRSLSASSRHILRGMALGVCIKHLADVGRLVQEAQERFLPRHTGVATPPIAAERERRAGAPIGEALARTVQPLQSRGGSAAGAPPGSELWGALLPAPVSVAWPLCARSAARGANARTPPATRALVGVPRISRWRAEPRPVVRIGAARLEQRKEGDEQWQPTAIISNRHRFGRWRMILREDQLKRWRRSLPVPMNCP